MYTPDPINTENIVLSDELLALTEKLAANVHDNWSAGRIAQGWTYGSVRDDAKKETPCLVPYDELPESEKEFDRNTALESLKTIISLGYKIVKDESDEASAEDSETEDNPIDYDELIKRKFRELFDDADDDEANEPEGMDDFDMNDSDALDNVIILSDENGEDVYFEFIDLIEYAGEEYIVLLPQEAEDEESGEVAIFKVDVSSANGEEEYIDVEDEETLNAVFDIFREKHKDEFNFAD